MKIFKISILEIAAFSYFGYSLGILACAVEPVTSVLEVIVFSFIAFASLATIIVSSALRRNKQ